MPTHSHKLAQVTSRDVPSRELAINLYIIWLSIIADNDTERFHTKDVSVKRLSISTVTELVFMKGLNQG